MTSVPETPGLRQNYERALRRTAERQDMRLVRSTLPDPIFPHYPTYTLISQSGSGPAVLKNVPMRTIEQYIHREDANTLYARVPAGERVEALEGNIVGVQPGAIIDSFRNNKRFVVAEDGQLIELPDEGWTTIPDDDR